MLTLLASDTGERIVNCYSGAVGPRSLTFDPEPRTMWCDSKVGPEVGTLRETLDWDSNKGT